jgi:nucleoid-associated protein YgaU
MMTRSLVLIMLMVLVGAFLAGCSQQASSAGPGEKMTWQYTVRPGDKSFADVSEKVYGDRQYSTLIAQANPEVAEAKIEPGQKLTIVSRTDAEGKVIQPKECDRKKIY